MIMVCSVHNCSRKLGAFCTPINEFETIVPERNEIVVTIMPPQANQLLEWKEISATFVRFMVLVECRVRKTINGAMRITEHARRNNSETGLLSWYFQDIVRNVFKVSISFKLLLYCFTWVYIMHDILIWSMNAHHDRTTLDFPEAQTAWFCLLEQLTRPVQGSKGISHKDFCLRKKLSTFFIFSAFADSSVNTAQAMTLMNKINDSAKTRTNWVLELENNKIVLKVVTFSRKWRLYSCSTLFCDAFEAEYTEK